MLQEISYYIAVDLGASSGRVLLSWYDSSIQLREVRRFENFLQHQFGHLSWDIEHLFAEIKNGLKQAHELLSQDITLPKGQIKSVAIDSWAVDYLLLDRDKHTLGPAISYRDSRTQGIAEALEKTLKISELYQITGIQKQSFNTIYQLLSERYEQPSRFEDAAHLLLIPDYLNWLLTGKIATEYTNATTTALVDARTRNWDFDLIDKLGLPRHIFSEIFEPGNILGNFSPEIAAELGFSAKVINCASHDTASAFAAAPIKSEHELIISSGTWSLVGLERMQPSCSERSCSLNFTNEGGYHKTYRFLKNIMGLWMNQSIRRELNGQSYIHADEGVNLLSKAYLSKLFSDYAADKIYSFPDLIEAAQSYTGDVCIIDVNDNRFLQPKSMIEEVLLACKDLGKNQPTSIAQLMQTVYMSLATSYKKTLVELERLFAIQISSIRIVGGGSQDAYLNQITANLCQLPVYAGPIEATGLGNIAVQMIALDEFSNSKQVRSVISQSNNILVYKPSFES